MDELWTAVNEFVRQRRGAEVRHSRQNGKRRGTRSMACPGKAKSIVADTWN